MFRVTYFLIERLQAQHWLKDAPFNCIYKLPHKIELACYIDDVCIKAISQFVMQKKGANLARCTCKFYNTYLDKWVILWLIKDSGSTQKNLNEAHIDKKMYTANNV